jgi:dihydroneopterin aldolase
VDIVYIKELRVETVIGIYEWERKSRQAVVMDIEVAADAEKAAEHDRIEDTVNYRAMVDRIAGFAGASRFQLVETLAVRIAAILQEEFAAPWCRVRIGKPGVVRGVRDVGVVVERGART